uniref:non-specific serine/threonine protein kinase n=1 Tax=Selaginella wallacei TaxID=189577 RepID=A0A126WZP2_9TRAC|nr:putative LOV domain-containing protein [Selaginella wallacei]
MDPASTDQSAGRDMLNVLSGFEFQRPALARDSRGSLEVFQPKSVSKHSFSSSPSLEAGLEQQKVPGSRGPAPVVSGQQADHKELELSPVRKTASGDPWSESRQEPLTEDVESERTAQWGLVLKAEVGSGRIKGVGVREDKSMRNSGASAVTSRTSQDSDAGSEQSRIPRVSEDLKDILSSFQQTFVVCDGLSQDFPILYASGGFFNMTGYSAKEVIGRNCRFLQGAGTDPADVAMVREALHEGKSYCGRLLNYKKDGTPFWNLLTIAPIQDEDGKVLKYIGMLVEVSKFTEGSKDKALRPNGLPESLIKYDARQKEKVAVEVCDLVDAFKEAPSVTKQPAHKRVSESNLSPVMEKTKKKRAKSSSLISLFRKSSSISDPVMHFTDEAPADEVPESMQRKREARRGLDLATTLERIEKNFVITDPRLPDNPIIFASDSFLELTEYSREEILGKNCRFLQGPDTNRDTVQQIRDAIQQQRSVTVQLLNYTKSGNPFWNLFHLQPMKDNKGELQYFIGVQLDGSHHFDRTRKALPENVKNDGVQVITTAAGNIDTAVREFPDANQTPESLWSQYTRRTVPKPHKRNASCWVAINKVLQQEGALNLKHFRPLKALGSGDTGGVHLVELRGTGKLYAMKAMKKSVMLNRNKIHRTMTERHILDMLDHPFLPTLYTSFETESHLCLITDFCPGGELFMLLDRQPSKTFDENVTRFFAAEVVTALEYLHCKGVVYRDLKPENILVQANGHIVLADFDLSFLSTSTPQLIETAAPTRKKRTGGHEVDKRRSKQAPLPTFMAEPVEKSNSFVGTEEYIAPEVISGRGHSSAVDWWALGILLFEMLHGFTPFRGKNRQKTFDNIVNADLVFPRNVQRSVAARQLIHGLLQKDPEMRLGSSTGANELKQHAFFKGVRWPLVRQKRLDTSIALESEHNITNSDVYNDVF